MKIFFKRKQQLKLKPLFSFVKKPPQISGSPECSPDFKIHCITDNKKEKNLQMKATTFLITLSDFKFNEFQVLIEFEKILNITYVFEEGLT